MTKTLIAITILILALIFLLEIFTINFHIPNSLENWIILCLTVISIPICISLISKGVKKMSSGNKSNKIKTYILIISFTTFIFSLTQTAFTYSDSCGVKTFSSSDSLLFGGLTVLNGDFFEWLIWLANPLYFLALNLFFNSKKASEKVSVTATMLALTFTTWNDINTSDNCNLATILSLNSGYWFWLLSITILSIGTINYFRNYAKKNDD